MATIPARLARAVGHILRRENRLPTFLAARLRLRNGSELRISLRNVSRSGFMGVVAGEPVRAGSRVILAVPLAGCVEADVRWSLNCQAGFELVGRFSARQMAILLLLGARGHLLSATGSLSLLTLACAALLLLA